jgi:hypothetical protein
LPRDITTRISCITAKIIGNFEPTKDFRRFFVICLDKFARKASNCFFKNSGSFCILSRGLKPWEKRGGEKIKLKDWRQFKTARQNATIVLRI